MTSHYPTFAAIWEALPPARDFFAAQGLPMPAPEAAPADYFAALSSDALAEVGTDAATLSARFADFLAALPRLGTGAPRVASLTVRGGTGKDGRPERLDLTLVPGDVVALVGPTGSGKTSLLEAMAGLVRLQAGDIDMGGPEPSAAWAGQAPALIPGTLLDNLMAADPGVTPEAALEMAQRVGLGAALDRREAGVETMIDERGGGLSGGERRRLSLARALLKPSTLLLLDEPTADLDAVAEAEMIALIRAAAGTRTVIVATHAESLAGIADQVVRLS